MTITQRAQYLRARAMSKLGKNANIENEIKGASSRLQKLTGKSKKR